MLFAFVRNVFQPTVSDRAGLWLYVRSVTLFSWLVAVIADAAERSVFFTGWADLARHECVTTLVVLVIAVPIARSMGYAHLELHFAKHEADRLGRVDPLTGVANRRAFYEAALKLDGGVVALAIADLDRFKRINDTFGHASGDEVLRQVAAIMQSELGDLGLVARLGGEEFALLCSHRNAGRARQRLQVFRQRVADLAVRVNGQAIAATVSIGFAARRDAGIDAIYADADKALYVAKSAGRDRLVDFDEIGEIAPLAEKLSRAG